MAAPRPQLRMTGDWHGGPPPPWSRRLRWWTATHWLIAANVAVYGVQLLSGDSVTPHGTFTIDAAFAHVQLWRLLTSDFLHVEPGHLIVNMIALWAFGPTVEGRLGRGRFVGLYLLSGLGGVGAYLLLWRLKVLHVDGSTELLGASGCTFGVLVAAGHLAGNRLFRFVWPPVEVRLVTIVWVCVGLAVVNVARGGENAGGDAAHLGGAAVGLLLIRNVTWFRAIGLGPKRHRFWRPGDPASNFFRPDA